MNVTPTVKKYSRVHRESTPFLEVLGTKNKLEYLNVENAFVKHVF